MFYLQSLCFTSSWWAISWWDPWWLERCKVPVSWFTWDGFHPLKTSPWCEKVTCPVSAVLTSDLEREWKGHCCRFQKNIIPKGAHFFFVPFLGSEVRKRIGSYMVYTRQCSLHLQAFHLSFARRLDEVEAYLLDMLNNRVAKRKESI